jgi:hypothetical protein
MNLVEPTAFQGTLAGNRRTASVAFELKVDDRGDMELQFEPVPRTRDALLLIPKMRPGDPRHCLALGGITADGQSIQSDTFYFSGLLSFFSLTRARETKKIKWPDAL